MDGENLRGETRMEMKTTKGAERKPSDNIDEVLLNGITFRGARKSPQKEDTGKVHTKAKKKGYITGAHGSASAKKKADIRRARTNRHKGK